MSSRFVSIGTASHPLETFDSTRNTKGKTIASDDISVGHHWKRAHRKRQDPGQAQPRTNEQTQVDHLQIETRETNAAETHA